MNSNTLFAALLSLAVLLFPPAGHTLLINIEEAFEGASVRLVRTDEGTATAIVQRCPTCEALKLKVTRETRFIRGGRAIKFSNDISLQGKPVDVFYRVEDKTVTRFKW